MLFAPDNPAAGIEYGVAHAACGINSDIRWDGCFTTTISRPRLALKLGDILSERRYYFHLLGPRYPIVPTSREWKFPHKTLHPCWQATQEHLSSEPFLHPDVPISQSAFIRDDSCRVSALTESKRGAYLCPPSEEDWFTRNDMEQYKLSQLFLHPTRAVTDDIVNYLPCRQDLHTLFDDGVFTFVPKKEKGKEEIAMVTHLLAASRELGTLYHNVRLKPIPDVGLPFLFARFALSIFRFCRYLGEHNLSDLGSLDHRCCRMQGVSSQLGWQSSATILLQWQNPRSEDIAQSLHRWVVRWLSKSYRAS